MSNYIQHRLFIRASSFEEAGRIVDRYARSEKPYSFMKEKPFSFTKVLPNPEGGDEDEVWNAENWGTRWDCSHAFILRPVGTPLIEIRFRTYGSIPKGVGRKLKEDLGEALIGWVVHYPCDVSAPRVLDAIKAACFDADDLKSVIWHEVDLETFEVPCCE